MQDFNDIALHSLMLSGYRYLLYYDLDYFALIVPLEREYETNEPGYIILSNTNRQWRWLQV
jgi:hypothetical protein